MKIKTENNTFFENYGLSVLLYNYTKHNSLDVYSEYDKITEMDLINYYNNTYVKYLKERGLIKLNINKYNYTGDVKDFDYCSSHILYNNIKYKSDYNKLFEKFDVNLNNKTDISMSPYTTKNMNVFQSTYPKSSSFFNLLSTVSCITDMKFCYYDYDLKSNVSFIPEFENIIDYIIYIDKFYDYILNFDYDYYMMNKINNNKKQRPPLHTIGNFDNKIYSNSKDYKFINIMIKISDLEFNNFFLGKNNKLDFKKWYLISYNNVHRFDINKDVSSFIYENRLNYKKIFNTFIKYDDDNSKKRFWYFLKKYNFDTLLNVINNTEIKINYENELLNNFLNKTIKKTNMENRELIKKFSEKISNVIYHHSKEYCEKNNDVSNNKERIDMKKERMLREIKQFLKRSYNLDDFLFMLSEYYTKHKIKSSVMCNDTNLYDKEMDFLEFKKLLTIYLKCSFYKSSKTNISQNGEKNDEF